MEGWKALGTGKQVITGVLLYTNSSLGIFSLLEPLPVFFAQFFCCKQASPSLRVLFPSQHRGLSIPTFSPLKVLCVQLVWLLQELARSQCRHLVFCFVLLFSFFFFFLPSIMNWPAFSLHEQNTKCCELLTAYNCDLLQRITLGSCESGATISSAMALKFCY